MVMKRSITITLAASLVLVIVAAGAATASAAAGSHPAQLRDPRNHELLVVGASYTAGWGASSPQLDYAHRLAAALDWPATISAEPGAGYLSRGNDGHDSFRQQIAALPASLRPGLVIIQGGRNDAHQPATRERAAIDATIAAIRAKFGNPQIVMVGDMPASLPVGAAAIATDDTLSRAAHDDDAVFIDPIREHWTTAQNAIAFRSSIPGHPNDAGHAYIAARLLADLSARTDATL
jgi:GDSL-like Lipase/Acylhydrolase family